MAETTAFLHLFRVFFLAAQEQDLVLEPTKKVPNTSSQVDGLKIGAAVGSPPHKPHVSGQLAETTAFTHLLVVFFLPTQKQVRVLVPTKKVPDTSSQVDGLEIGAAVGSDPPQDPHVSGQLAETIALLHLLSVLFLPAQKQDLVLVPTKKVPDTSLHVDLDGLDVGVLTVGLLIGLAVGVDTGLADVLADGKTLGRKVGIVDGCDDGGGDVEDPPIVISNVIVEPATLMFDIVTSVSMILPPWYAFVFGYAEPVEIPFGPIASTFPPWKGSPVSPLLNALSNP